MQTSLTSFIEPDAYPQTVLKACCGPETRQFNVGQISAHTRLEWLGLNICGFVTLAWSGH